MEDLFQIGIITGTHGLKGEVKVFPTTDDKERFLDLDTVLIDTGKELIEKKVQYCKFFKQFVFVKFEGLDDINDVEKYKRCPLKVTRENAVPLEEDEYYVADLLGLTIVDESGARSSFSAHRWLRIRLRYRMRGTVSGIISWRTSCQSLF